MPTLARHHRWGLVLLVFGTGVLFLAQCVIATVTVPQPLAAAGLCEHRCAPVSFQTSAPVVLPTLSHLLPLPQTPSSVGDEGERHVLSLVTQGVAHMRAPPQTTILLAFAA